MNDLTLKKGFPLSTKIKEAVDRFGEIESILKPLIQAEQNRLEQKIEQLCSLSQNKI